MQFRVEHGLPHEWDSRCWAFNCTFNGIPEQLRKCSKCKIARYCSKECQARDWRMAHRDRCGEYAAMAPMAKTVVHPRCVLPIQKSSFPDDVRGYLTSSTGYGERLGQTSWHFTKVEDANRQRWFLEHGFTGKRYQTCGVSFIATTQDSWPWWRARPHCSTPAQHRQSYEFETNYGCSAMKSRDP